MVVIWLLQCAEHGVKLVVNGLPLRRVTALRRRCGCHGASFMDAPKCGVVAVGEDPGGPCDPSSFPRTGFTSVASTVNVRFPRYVFLFVWLFLLGCNPETDDTWCGWHLHTH